MGLLKDGPGEDEELESFRADGCLFIETEVYLTIVFIHFDIKIRIVSR